MCQMKLKLTQSNKYKTIEGFVNLSKRTKFCKSYKLLRMSRNDWLHEQSKSSFSLLSYAIRMCMLYT